MSQVDRRAVSAAMRLLDGVARGSALSRVRIELAAWLVGSGGGSPPNLPDPADDLHARLAALLGARLDEAAEAFLADHLPRVPGERLLFTACTLAGDRMADTLVDLAHRLGSAWFSGPMLARTTRPDRLMALFDSPRGRHAIATVGELVIDGRDRGAPSADAEARWAAIAAEPSYTFSYMSEYCDAAIRIVVRQDLDEAIELLSVFEEPDKPGRVFDGAHAVLARLVRQDADRAVALATEAESSQDKAIRLGGLAWWFELPDAAGPLIERLLRERDPYVVLSLIRDGAACRQPWLGRALASAANESPIEVADRLALGVHALRVAGRDQEAEQVREQLLPILVSASHGVDGISPLDLFDVVSAPGRPPMAPWRTPPGLPQPCP